MHEIGLKLKLLIFFLNFDLAKGGEEFQKIFLQKIDQTECVIRSCYQVQKTCSTKHLRFRYKTL